MVANGARGSAIFGGSQRGVVGDQGGGDVGQLDVEVLGGAAQEVERGVGVETLPGQEDACGLPDDVAGGDRPAQVDTLQLGELDASNPGTSDPLVPSPPFR
jgi:hypothetical protein